MVASFAAYFELEGGYYIELTNGTVDSGFTFCPNRYNEAFMAVNFDCAQLNFYIAQKPDGSFAITSMFGEVTYGPGFLLSPIDGWATKKANHSLRCVSDTLVPLVGGKESPALSIVMSNVTVEAFRDNTGPDFYQVQDHCAEDLKV